MASTTGRMALVFPKEVAKAIRVKAIIEEVSINDLIMEALADKYSDDRYLGQAIEDALNASVLAGDAVPGDDDNSADDDLGDTGDGEYRAD